MLERASLVIRGRSDHTKRRQQTDILLKKAMNGDRRAKLKLYKEFGIRLYSSEEVEKYVQERVSHEYASSGRSTNNGPTLVTRKREAKGLSKNETKQTRSKSLLSRGKLRERSRKLVKKI